ncbi:MAG: hypothetical protein B6I23_01170 [Rickettsiaceae bacterium 4572_127]|nr:MAG: hypothetical protein B6I23_01170 [Rickettsiaceae bacterium 4572_127]
MKKLYNLFFKRARKKTKVWYVFLVLPVLIAVFFFPQAEKSFSKKALVDGGNFTGYVIAERHAQFSQDYKTASFYAEKIMQNSKKTDEKSLKKLFSYFILSGDFDKTRLFLSENPAEFKKNRLGQFLILTDAVKKNDYKTANKIVKNIEKGNSDKLALPLIKTWILAGQNKKEEAKKSLKFIDTADTRILYLMHSFYLNNYFGEDKKALKILEKFDEAQKLNVRFIDYASLFLEKNKDKKTAINFIKKRLETEKSYANKLYLKRFISEKSNHKKFNSHDGLTEAFID